MTRYMICVAIGDVRVAQANAESAILPLVHLFVGPQVKGVTSSRTHGTVIEVTGVDGIRVAVRDGSTEYDALRGEHRGWYSLRARDVFYAASEAEAADRIRATLARRFTAPCVARILDALAEHTTPNRAASAAA